MTFTVDWVCEKSQPSCDRLAHANLLLMNEHLHMVHKNLHTKDCMFVAPSVDNVDRIFSEICWDVVCLFILTNLFLHSLPGLLLSGCVV